MTCSKFRLFAAMSVALWTVPAAAALDDNWLVSGRDRSNGCELTITANTQTMLLRASGLIPGEVYRFQLTNGDMKPIAFSGLADNRGALVQYYLPFRLNRDGGTVRVRIAAARCNLAAQADWDRGVVTIP